MTGPASGPRARLVRAFGLVIQDERLEDRLSTIIDGMVAALGDDGVWVIDGLLEATGPLGSRMATQLDTQRFDPDDGRPLRLTMAELRAILREDGQVIELDAIWEQFGREVLRVIVRDGLSVDVLQAGKVLDDAMLGQCIEMDPELFLWAPP